MAAPEQARVPGGAFGRSPEGGDGWGGAWWWVLRKELRSADHPAARPAWQDVAQPAVRGGGSLLPGPEPEGTLGPEGWGQLSRSCPRPRPSPGLPFSSCSTATGSVGGGGSSTRLSSASTRPGRLGGQMPMWSPGWYWSPSWPPVSRRTRMVARLGMGRRGSYRRAEGMKGREGRMREEGPGVWGRRGRDRCVLGSGPPHVDLLLCRFSTERTVAWNIFRLCTWIRPEGWGANETEPELGTWAWPPSESGDPREPKGPTESG